MFLEHVVHAGKEQLGFKFLSHKNTNEFIENRSLEKL
jgi:hypothetical protein